MIITGIWVANPAVMPDHYEWGTQNSLVTI
jgi:hypothetical protein